MSGRHELRAYHTESGTSPSEAEVGTVGTSRRALAAVFSLGVAIALPSPVLAQGVITSYSIHYTKLYDRNHAHAIDEFWFLTGCLRHFLHGDAAGAEGDTHHR